MSLTRSLSECMPSATIAPLRPTMPATIFSAASTILITLPSSVTRVICLSLSFIAQKKIGEPTYGFEGSPIGLDCLI